MWSTPCALRSSQYIAHVCVCVCVCLSVYVCVCACVSELVGGWGCIQLGGWDLMEAAVSVHSLDGTNKLVRHQLRGHNNKPRREGQHARRAVIGKVDENSVVGAAIYDAPRAWHLGHGSRVAAKHRKEILGCDLLVRVVLGHARIHIGAVWLVVHGAFARVEKGPDHVVIKHNDNLLVRNPTCVHHLRHGARARAVKSWG